MSRKNVDETYGSSVLLLTLIRLQNRSMEGVRRVFHFLFREALQKAEKTEYVVVPHVLRQEQLWILKMNCLRYDINGLRCWVRRVDIECLALKEGLETSQPSFFWSTSWSTTDQRHRDGTFCLLEEWTTL